MTPHELLLALQAATPSAELEADLLALVDARWTLEDARAEAASLRLARDLAELQASADLAGRVAVRFGLAGVPVQTFRSRTGSVLPVAFVEAVRDLRARDPIGANALARGGLEVSEVYGGIVTPRGVVYPHAFALVRGLEDEVAKKIRDVIARGIERAATTKQLTGSVVRVGQRLPESVRDWTRSYCATVVRTNVATAYSAGRFREATALARDLEGTGVEVGFEFRTAGDGDVRSGRPQDHGENHAAMNGVRARVDDPIWLRYSPPASWNCRCVVTPVVGEKLPRRARVPAGVQFAPGFGSRPDLAAYSSR